MEKMTENVERVEGKTAGKVETMKDFERELDKSFRVMKKGDIIDGIIVDINEDGVTLDIGYYTQGFSPCDELSYDPAFRPMFDLKIGDTVKGQVLDTDDGNGNVLISLKEANQILAWDGLREMFENQTKVDVKIESAVNQGVVAYLNGVRAFIPASQLSTTYVEDADEWVGKKVTAVIITVDESKEKLVLSAKVVEKEKLEESKRRKMSGISKGMILNGKVESLQPYGAFVELENGLSGLVHISNISMKRLKKPSEVLSVGQEVKVKVIDIKDGKIGLSIKDVENNTSEVVTEIEETDFHYEDKDDEPNNPFAALLKDIKFD